MSEIPYSGTLFSQGLPVNQELPVQMAFALYNDQADLRSGATDAAPPERRVWTSWGAGDTVGAEQTIGVSVRGGSFLVRLGGEGQWALTHPLFTKTDTLYL